MDNFRGEPVQNVVLRLMKQIKPEGGTVDYFSWDAQLITAGILLSRERETATTELTKSRSAK